MIETAIIAVFIWRCFKTLGHRAYWPHIEFPRTTSCLKSLSNSATPVYRECFYGEPFLRQQAAYLPFLYGKVWVASGESPVEGASKRFFLTVE